MNTHLTNTTRHSQPRVLFAATVAVTIRAFLLPIATHLQQKGWRVDAIANGIANDEACRSTFERVWDAEWDRNPLDVRNLMMIGRLRDIVLKHEYDIVHVHTPVAGFVTRFALNSLRHDQQLQVLYTAHGFHFHSMANPISNRLFETLERRAADWTDFLILINREDLLAATEKNLICRNCVRFMPGIGVDRARYSSSSVSPNELNGVCNELGISAGTPVLLMVAEFTERKRHADALHAFSKVVHPRAQLVLVGSGPLLNRMERLATTLGIAGRTHFLGYRSDVAVLMKASRALILPSSQEGLPRSILEAMSMGIPVIGSRIRGTTELLELNAGLLFDVGDIDQLAHAMQLVIDNATLAETMGQTGRRQSEAYDLTHILRMHDELYEEAIELRRARARGPLAIRRSPDLVTDV